jgi:hypothetical protein
LLWTFTTPRCKKLGQNYAHCSIKQIIFIFLGGDGLFLEVNFSTNCFMKKQEDNLYICPTKYTVGFFPSVKGLAHEIVLEALMRLL